MAELQWFLSVVSKGRGMRQVQRAPHQFTELIHTKEGGARRECKIKMFSSMRGNKFALKIILAKPSKRNKIESLARPDAID